MPRGVSPLGFPFPFLGRRSLWTHPHPRSPHPGPAAVDRAVHTNQQLLPLLKGPRRLSHFPGSCQKEGTPAGGVDGRTGGGVLCQRLPPDRDRLPAGPCAAGCFNPFCSLQSFRPTGEIVGEASQLVRIIWMGEIESSFILSSAKETHLPGCLSTPASPCCPHLHGSPPGLTFVPIPCISLAVPVPVWKIVGTHRAQKLCSCTLAFCLDLTTITPLVWIPFCCCKPLNLLAQRRQGPYLHLGAPQPFLMLRTCLSAVKNLSTRLF